MECFTIKIELLRVNSASLDPEMQKVFNKVGESGKKWEILVYIYAL